MTSRERVTAILNFERADRLPVIEWAPHWDKTVARWKSEGLPESLSSPAEINDYFGLDAFRSLWVTGCGPGCPRPEAHGKPMIHGESDYDAILPHLYPGLAPQVLEKAAEDQVNGAAIWFWFEGFFWHPRSLFGIEEHMYAFFDQPRLMERIDDDVLEYLHRVTDQICEYVSPQFMAIGEDMSYNHGPMISKPMFDEHLARYYVRATEFLKSRGIKVIVDSDGLVDEPVDWYAEVGCEGFLPLEKQAGVDLVKYRERHPKFLFVGGFDKLCMHKGEEAMRSEFERLLPVMKQGGYIPGVDHQTPPEVSLDDYKLYIKLLREYAQQAVR